MCRGFEAAACGVHVGVRPSKTRIAWNMENGRFLCFTDAALTAVAMTGGYLHLTRVSPTVRGPPEAPQVIHVHTARACDTCMRYLCVLSPVARLVAQLHHVRRTS